jgi:hypothetical protein
MVPTGAASAFAHGNQPTCAWVSHKEHVRLAAGSCPGGIHVRNPASDHHQNRQLYHIEPKHLRKALEPLHGIRRARSRTTVAGAIAPSPPSPTSPPGFLALARATWGQNEATIWLRAVRGRSKWSRQCC